MEPKTFKIEAKLGPEAPKWSQNGAKTAKKSENNKDPTKKWGDSIHAAPFWSKMWPTWPQVGFQKRTKIDKKSMPKSIKKLMHLGIDFWEDLGGFWEPKWSHVGTKIASGSDLMLK